MLESEFLVYFIALAMIGGLFFRVGWVAFEFFDWLLDKALYCISSRLAHRKHRD